MGYPYPKFCLCAFVWGPRRAYPVRFGVGCSDVLMGFRVLLWVLGV